MEIAASVVGASVGFAGNPQAVHAFLDSSLYMDKKKYEMIICFSFCFCYQSSFQGHIFLNSGLDISVSQESLQSDMKAGLSIRLIPQFGPCIPN